MEAQPVHTVRMIGSRHIRREGERVAMATSFNASDRAAEV
jgi:hypothetical protein